MTKMLKLKEIRIQNDLSYADISRRLGISQPYYWQIENNKRRLYYDLAIKIAKIFNMKPDDIFYEKIEKED